MDDDEFDEGTTSSVTKSGWFINEIVIISNGNRCISNKEIRLDDDEGKKKAVTQQTAPHQ